MPYLENEQFLNELTKMFARARSGGSVFVTMKRWDGRTKPVPKNADNSTPVAHHQEYKCLFRAELKNKKISTAVNPKDVNKFQLAYATIMKNNMDNLKKRGKGGDKEKKSTVTRAAKSDH